jgi:hypothetical protein
VEISEFRDALEDFTGYGDKAALSDEQWWEQFGELLDVVLATRARAKRAAREANRCPALYHGVTRCVRARHDVGNHFNPTTGQWKNERMMTS